MDKCEQNDCPVCGPRFIKGYGSTPDEARANAKANTDAAQGRCRAERRERIATAALLAMLTRGRHTPDPTVASKVALSYADALIAALDGKNESGRVTGDPLGVRTYHPPNCDCVQCQDGKAP